MDNWVTGVLELLKCDVNAKVTKREANTSMRVQTF